MNLHKPRGLDADSEHGFVACIYAVDRAKIRMAQQDGNLEEARKLAAEQRFTLPEAVEIVRRSRR